MAGIVKAQGYCLLARRGIILVIATDIWFTLSTTAQNGKYPSVIPHCWPGREHWATAGAGHTLTGGPSYATPRFGVLFEHPWGSGSQLCQVGGGEEGRPSEIALAKSRVSN